MLHHGGRLRRAAQDYGIPLNDWLDLSTGINPHAWPVPAFEPVEWNRLPEDEDGLAEAAADYYGGSVLPVAGSQAAIQAIPRLRAPCRVGVLDPGYAEHAHAWRVAGHEVLPLAASEIDRQLDQLDALVLISPNNPTGERFPREQLLDWHSRLASRGGWLLIDEAFADAEDGDSLVPLATSTAGLIVLRSLGKFFGLAGARVGFVACEQALRGQLAEYLGPWSIAGPARTAARLALSDCDWQREIRARLQTDSQRLAALLIDHGLTPDGGTALFQWCRTPRAEALHHAMAQRGVLLRLFEQPTSLRFGLPGCESDWQRLDHCLRQATTELKGAAKNEDFFVSARKHCAQNRSV